MKACSECKTVKPLGEYYKRSDCANGVYSACKECFRDKLLLKRYGITRGEYDELVEQHGGVCAVCGDTCGTRDRLSVDHCHSSGVVRGLLCDTCNKGIGILGDCPDKLRKAIAYLQRGLVAEQVWGGVL